MGRTARNDESQTFRRDVALVVGFRILISLAARALGALPVSDDDFARLTISQRFALAPTWDPSGTSWLPAPFWLEGGVLSIFGRDPVVAERVAIVTSGLSAGVLCVAAGWLGASRHAALAVGLISSLLPHVTWFGMATIPDGYTAALVVLAVASLEGPPSRRTVVAAALGIASLCRYETWALVCLFAVRGAFEWHRGAAFRRVLPLLLPALGPLAWMLHGALQHGDAMFFLRRVAEYRRALGVESRGDFATLLAAPWTLIRAEPFVTGLMVLAVWFRRAELGKFRSALACCGAVLVFLVVGDYGDGAATHHPERALLGPILLCLIVGVAVMERDVARRPRAWAFGALGLFVASAALHPLLRSAGSVDRRTELALGRALRAPLGAGTLALVESPDFGYFAVAAGVGVPSRVEPLTSPDPRHRDAAPVERSARGLARAARGRGATHLALRTDGDFPPPEGGTLLLTTARYRVFQLATAPPSLTK